MIRVPTARDLVKEWYVVLRPDMDVYEAIDLLEAKRASGAPVVDKDGMLLGILTEKDCIRVLTRAAYGELAGGTVADYMSEVKNVITPEMDLFSAAREFLATNFAVLPVVENGKPVGRLSRQDMLRGIQRLEREIEKAKAQELEQVRKLQQPSMAIDDLQRLAASQSPQGLADIMRHRER